MVTIEIDGLVYKCIEEQWKGSNPLIVGVLQRGLDRSREDFTIGADPDPDGSVIVFADGDFPDLKVIGRDAVLKSEDGVIY